MSDLVVLEGIDGSGKETQTKKIVSRLRKEGETVNTMSFPTYDGVFSKPVEHLLSGAKGLSQRQKAVLFGVDRLGAKEELEALLEQGVVVCDRYVTANKGYQGVGIDNKKEFYEWLDSFEYDVLGLPREKGTIFLDLPVDIAIHNMTDKKKDSYERNTTFLKEVRKEFKDLAEREDWHIIHCWDSSKGMRSIEDIHEDVYDACKLILNSDIE